MRLRQDRETHLKRHTERMGRRRRISTRRSSVRLAAGFLLAGASSILWGAGGRSPPWGWCRPALQLDHSLVLQVEAVLLFQNWRMGSDSITFGSVEARPAMEAAAAGMSKKGVATADWGRSTPQGLLACLCGCGK